jgi:PEGA domain
MNDEHEPSPGDDELPPRAWLEEWTVPELPRDLSQRVMSRMNETPPLSPPLMFAHARSSTVVATGVAVFAAAAAAAALVISVARPPAEPREPARVAEPAAAVVIAGDAEIESLGHLVLDVAPGDAEVEIDGQSVAGPSPFVATNLPAGRHELRVHHVGYQPWIKVIDVPAAELQLPITLVTEKPSEAADADRGMRRSTPVAVDADVSPSDPLLPRVRQPTVAVVGDMNKDVIRRVVRAHIGEVRHCYNEGLLRNPALTGTVSVQFTIGPDGSVQKSEVASSTLPDAGVGTCIAGAIGMWKFPKPTGGSATVVTYPFLLESG